MYSYSFYNNKKINRNGLTEKIVKAYNLDLIDKTSTNVVLGNNEVLIDISKQYIFILLFNDNFNISKLTNYLLRFTNGQKKKRKY